MVEEQKQFSLCFSCHLSPWPVVWPWRGIFGPHAAQANHTASPQVSLHTPAHVRTFLCPGYRVNSRGQSRPQVGQLESSHEAKRP